MDSETVFDQIEAYLDGTLSADQRAQFERDLSADARLQEEVERHRKANLVIRHGLRAEWKTRLQAIDAESKEQPAIRRKLGYRIAAAASFLVIVAIGAHFYAHGKYASDALAKHAFGMESQEIFRDDQAATGIAGRMAQANTLFTSEKYTEAGMLYMEIAREASMFRDQAEWNLLLCYLAENPDSDQFRIVQQKILSNPDHQYHDQAIALQQQMSGILYRLVN